MNGVKVRHQCEKIENGCSSLRGRKRKTTKKKKMKIKTKGTPNAVGLSDED